MAETKPEGPVALTRDAEVVKTVTEHGTGDPAGRGAHVQLTYTLHLADSPEGADPVDSSDGLRRGVLRFTTGRNKVIAALDVAAQSMRQGERARVRASSQYAFGARGLARRGVPPDAAVRLDVAMLAFEGGEKVKALAEMTPRERFESARRFKEEGNQLFKEVKFEKAMMSYTQCIRFLANVFYKPDLVGQTAKPQSSSSAKAEAEAPKAEEGTNAMAAADAKSVDVRNVEQAAAEGTPDADTEQANGQPDESGFDQAEIAEPAVEDSAQQTAAVGDEQETAATDTALGEKDGAEAGATEDGDGNDDDVEVVDVSTASRGDEETVVSDPAAGTTTPSATPEEKGEDGKEQETAQEGIPNGTTEHDAADGQNEKETKQTESEGTGDKDQADEDDEAPDEKEIKSLHVTTLNNLSLCLIKMEEYRRAVESATLALRMDEGSSKALYYRGRALEALGEWDKARDDLTAAAKIQPNNVGIRMEIAKLEKKRKVHHSLERKQAAAMFA